MNNFIEYLTSCFQTKHSNLHIFAYLPQELKDKICVLSGHFKLRYDNKTRRHILVAQLNLHSPEWKKFEKLLWLCIQQHETQTITVNVARYEYSASGFGGIAYTY